MPTFIRAAEIWLPDPAGQLLEFGSGVYLHAPAFGHASRAMCFGRGEGLPGRVWEEGRPVVLDDLQGGYFQRAAAARAAGLTCAVGFAAWFGPLLKAVVVIFCSGAATDPGGLALHDAGDEPDGFEPGRLRLRCAGAPGTPEQVVALRGGAGQPVAARVERFVAGADAHALRRTHGIDAALGALPAEDRRAEAEPTAFAAFAAGVPQTGPGGQIALPRVRDGAVAEVLSIGF